MGSEPLDVLVGDFNHDTKSDLAVTNSSSGTVSILLGNGDGALQSHVTYPAGDSPQSLAASDFDSNGIADLVVTGLTAMPLRSCSGMATARSPRRSSIR